MELEGHTPRGGGGGGSMCGDVGDSHIKVTGPIVGNFEKVPEFDVLWEEFEQFFTTKKYQNQLTDINFLLYVLAQPTKK